jgi:predicted glycosyltransferase
LLYFGTFGDDELHLPEMDGVTLLSMTKMPEPAVVIDPNQWSFPDVVASVDCVIAKPGYGTTGECMANRTPMVFYPRTEFAEYPVLRKGLLEWGGSVQMSMRDFLRGKWSGALEEAFQLRPPKVKTDGAAQTARIIMELIEAELT